MKTKKVICASCRKKVDFIIRDCDDAANIKDGNGKMHHIPYVRKYAYCKECGNEVWVPEVDDYNANALPRLIVFAKQCEKCEHRLLCRMLHNCENCVMYRDNKCYCYQTPDQTEREFCALYWPLETYPEEREDKE